MSTTNTDSAHAPPTESTSENEVEEAAIDLFDNIAHSERVCYSCLRAKLQSDELTEWQESGAPPAAKAKICSRCGTGRPGDEREDGGFLSRTWGRDRPLCARGAGEHSITTILRRTLTRAAELHDVEMTDSAVEAAYDRAMSLKCGTDEYASKDREVLAAGLHAALIEDGYHLQPGGAVVEDPEVHRVRGEST